MVGGVGIVLVTPHTKHTLASQAEFAECVVNIQLPSVNLVTRLLYYHYLQPLQQYLVSVSTYCTWFY
jgi:hypothetical protein